MSRDCTRCRVAGQGTRAKVQPQAAPGALGRGLTPLEIQRFILGQTKMPHGGKHSLHSSEWLQPETGSVPSRRAARQMQFPRPPSPPRLTYSAYMAGRERVSNSLSSLPTWPSFSTKPWAGPLALLPCLCFLPPFNPLPPILFASPEP